MTGEQCAEAAAKVSDLSADISPDYSCEILLDRAQPIRGGNTPMITEQADMSELIRELRRRMGLTQEQFAAELGVTFPTINRWEHGRARPSPLALKQIQAVLKHLHERGH